MTHPDKILLLVEECENLQEQKRVNVDFPTWMIESLDREAGKLGITRQSIIKVWLAERLEESTSNITRRRKRRDAALN